jgi:ADP-ribose pyrophosphatase
MSVFLDAAGGDEPPFLLNHPNFYTAIQSGKTMEETILTTTLIYSGRVVTLNVHTVHLPDGNQAQREIIQHAGAVAIIAVDADQHVLLVRQFRLGANQIMLEIPAGTLEPGEPPESCAARELREETGYRPLHLDYMGGLYAAPGYTTEYVHLFYTNAIEPAPLAQDADEFLESTRIPLLDALALIDSGAINDSKTVIGLLRVARRLGIA